MQHFEKDPSKMNIEEAQAAYAHATRNMSPDQTQAIEKNPGERYNDDAKTALCKRLWRRIEHLDPANAKRYV